MLSSICFIRCIIISFKHSFIEISHMLTQIYERLLVIATIMLLAIFFYYPRPLLLRPVCQEKNLQKDKVSTALSANFRNTSFRLFK